MSVQLIAGIIAFCIAVTSAVVANLLVTMMIGEINRKRQDGNLVSYFGFATPKMQRIFDEYRRSYPGGKLHIYALAAIATAMIGLVIVAAIVGIPALRAGSRT
jgi:hypothetical protein